MQGIQYPPKTIMEVFKSLPEGTLAEIIDGKLYMSPGASEKHQRVHFDLNFDLSSFIRNTQIGRLYYAPFDVFLDEQGNAVQPDFLIVLNDNLKIVKDDGVHGAPDFIIEILSPWNSRYDLITKKDLYEKFGVSEYWVVNPKTKESTGYLLKDGIYSPLTGGFGKIKSVILNHEFSF